MKRLVKVFDDFSIWKILEKEDLKQISELVMCVNYKHHLHQDYYPTNELQKLHCEDVEALTCSSFYAVFDEKMEIVGAVKSQKWDNVSVLTIERDFMVNLKYFIHSLANKPKDVYHIGRFAIDQDKIRKSHALRKKRVTIMKLLMYYALLPVYQGNSNIFFCECDEKLYSKLNLFGIYPHIIGSPKIYLGSKTLPIYCDKSGISNFINQNKQFNHV